MTLKKWIIVLLIVLVLVVAGGYFLGLHEIFLSPSGGGVWTPIELNAENLPQHLSQFGAVDDLPKEGSVALTIGDNSYSIEKGSVAAGESSEADVSITLPESYFEVFGEKGWCAGLQEAADNNDVQIEVSGSEAELAWKYRGLAKYRGCVG